MPWIERRALSLCFLAAACALASPAGGQTAALQATVATANPAASAPAPATTADELDFEFFKTKVEPIFLKERSGHAPCYGCHVLETREFHLEPLSTGSKNWTDDQSRKNFESVLNQVTVGDPVASRLLKHPLAPEAGGDAFHSGGRQFESQNDSDWQIIAAWVRGSSKQAPSSPQPDATTLVYVTNSASDSIDVIDPRTNQVVQVIHGITLPHGIAFSPDGTRLYISNESESVLDIVDRKSGDILDRVPLSGRPNNIGITKDGSRVLVGIRTEAGVVDVIDTASRKRTKSIPVNGSVHNVFVTPDGKFAVSGSIESKAATVIDLQTEKVAWEIKFDRPVRPMAFESRC